jgi:hypothetical protein
MARVHDAARRRVHSLITGAGEAMKQILLAGCALPMLCASAHARGLPQFMLGEWCLSDGVYVHGKCTPNSDAELTIREHSYRRGHEKDCKFHKARWLKGNTYMVYARCSG